MTATITWGILPENLFERVIVFSPHFDDAALGAAHLLFAHPESTVVTVFGGRPPEYPDPPSEWDALGGFRSGDDVVAVRREEDAAAMKVLDARPVWLEFADHQYLDPPDRDTPGTIAVELARVIDEERPTAVFLPMGLANPDHVATHDAGMLVAPQRSDLAWFCYEDSGYKHIPGMLAWRVSKLFRSDLWPTPMIVPTDVDHERKRAAIECYVSQLAPLNRDHALGSRIGGSVPEQFWRLEPPPSGWERMRDL
ncbi:MAG TPA: PIG-L family deacetylase [Acidimicrobiia bacterium]|nr:PIG-L family deacetylase [Acidimicrobiia bacterium]